MSLSSRSSYSKKKNSFGVQTYDVRIKDETEVIGDCRKLRSQNLYNLAPLSTMTLIMWSKCKGHVVLTEKMTHVHIILVVKPERGTQKDLEEMVC